MLLTGWKSSLAAASNAVRYEVDDVTMGDKWKLLLLLLVFCPSHRWKLIVQRTFDAFVQQQPSIDFAIRQKYISDKQSSNLFECANECSWSKTFKTIVNLTASIWFRCDEIKAKLFHLFLLKWMNSRRRQRKTFFFSISSNDAKID